MKFFRNLKDEDYNTDVIFVPIIWLITGIVLGYLHNEKGDPILYVILISGLTFIILKFINIIISLYIRNGREKHIENKNTNYGNNN